MPLRGACAEQEIQTLVQPLLVPAGAAREVHGPDAEVEVDHESVALRLEDPELPQLNSRFSPERRWERHLHGCHTSSVTLGM